jgi:hypothetical protein
MRNMAMRSQIYEWTNTAQGGTGFTLFRRSSDTSVAITNANTETSIFIGGIGYNITKPAETTATQFVVIEDVSCTPFATGSATNNGGFTQIRINTTNYFQNPDVTQQSGIPGTASPYPRGYQNILKTFDLYPDIYVLPGQVWDVIFTNGVALATATPADVVAVFVKYTLYDGPDALIANKLLELGITVNPNNVDWYKRTLIEQQSASMGGMA